MTNDQNESKLEVWLARVHVRPAAKVALRQIARVEHIPMATLIGYAIDNYVTARSTA